MHRRVLAIGLAAFLAGCPALSGAVKPGSGPSSALPGAVAPAGQSTSAMSRHIGSLVFGKLTDATKAMLAGGGGDAPQTSTSNASAPVADNSAADTKGAAVAIPESASAAASGAATGGGSGSSGAPAPAPAPAQPSSVTTPLGAGLRAPMPVSQPFYYGSYMSGPYGPMRLDSVSEASSAGFAGSFDDMLTTVINPVISAWANDAYLVSASSLLDSQGAVANSTNSSPSGWRLSFSAPSLGEAMTFFVTTTKTTAVLMHWVALRVDTKAMAVGPKAAIDKVVAAIGDASFKSKEDQLGVGYYLHDSNDPFGIGSGVNTAVSTAVAVSAPGSSVAPVPAPTPMVLAGTPVQAGPGIASSGSGAASAGSSTTVIGSSGGSSTAGAGSTSLNSGYVTPTCWQSSYDSQPVLTLPSGGNWFTQLEAVGNLVVWDLTFAPPPSESPYPVPKGVMTPLAQGAPGAAGSAVSGPPIPAPSPTPYSYSYSNSYVHALVDVNSGDIVQLSRPSKVTVTEIPNPCVVYGGPITGKPLIPQSAPGTPPPVGPLPVKVLPTQGAG